MQTQQTQHYKLKATEDHIKNAHPGGLVFENNDSDEIIGFIDFVSDCEISVMLFEPMELKDFMIQIAETCDFEPRLLEIFEEDKDIARAWAKCI